MHRHLGEATGVEIAFPPIAVDTETAARLLGVSPSTIRAHMRRGDLIPRYSGAKPIFSIEDLRAFVDDLPSNPRRI
jgi:hypothetical protein